MYAFFRDDETGAEVLSLEYIPGERLDAVWPRLDQAAKDAMLTTLHGYLDELRRLPSPARTGGDDWISAVPRLLDPYYTEFLAVGNWIGWYIFGGQI